MDDDCPVLVSGVAGRGVSADCGSGPGDAGDERGLGSAMSLKVILTSAIRRRIAEIEEAEARESDAPSSDPLTTITPIEILKVGLADTLVCAVRGQRAARLGQLPVRAHAVARVVDWESRQRRARRRAS